MDYNNKKTIEECSFFEIIINDKFLKFQLKILILTIIPCLIAINLCFKNYDRVNEKKREFLHKLSKINE